MSWTTHHRGEVAGRPITVQTHSEGGFRVRTDQGEDHPGAVIVDESSKLFMPPTEKGRPIDIDEDTIEEVRKALAQEGFNAQQIDEIVEHFPK